MKSFLVAVLACVVIASCSGTAPVITPDGCVLAERVSGSGQKYRVGICQDDRVVFQWVSDQDATVRLTRFPSGVVVIQYETEGGWVKWSAKSGVMIGPVPAEIEE